MVVKPRAETEEVERVDCCHAPDSADDASAGRYSYRRRWEGADDEAAEWREIIKESVQPRAKANDDQGHLGRMICLDRY
jgi:hypothetical protein